MSRLAALAAFDSMTSDEWFTIRPKRLSRQAIRDALEDGRIDPAVFVRNLDLARQINELEDAAGVLYDRVEPMPIRRTVDMRIVLEVVA